MHKQPVRSVESAVAYRVPVGLPGGGRMFLAALGTVPTSGWSAPQLAPRFYPHPPADGIWEFDFVADPPVGTVLDVALPIAAAGYQPCPDWVKGVRIVASDNAQTVKLQNDVELREADGLALKDQPGPVRNVVVSETIAIFDDSFQPIGLCGPFKLKMKKLRHELILTIEGPDEAKIRRCLEEAAAAGLIAACVAAFVTGGAALPAAIGAATSYLKGCLASGFSVRFDDRSHWIEWCT